WLRTCCAAVYRAASAIAATLPAVSTRRADGRVSAASTAAATTRPVGTPATSPAPTPAATVAPTRVRVVGRSRAGEASGDEVSGVDVSGEASSGPADGTRTTRGAPRRGSTSASARQITTPAADAARAHHTRRCGVHVRRMWMAAPAALGSTYHPLA